MRFKERLLDIKWTLQDWFWRIQRFFGHKDPPSYGFFLDAIFDPPLPEESVDDTLDEFIELVESMNLYTGGGFWHKDMDMFICGEHTSIHDRKSLVSWCIRHGASWVYASDIREENISEPFCAIHFRDVDNMISQRKEK